ncbi:MAG: AAA family ATPase, partial [Deltaproteobacteria bacterium]|nr:AAA family ATPase [Deltaproteobacteria bacterium]
MGKTTLLKGLKTILSVNLLDPDEQLAFNKSPQNLIERLYAASMKGTVLIDEIQKVPKLLDVVHSLMEENRELRFVMSGSSARKLRRGASANLLGGRALYRTLHPLTFEELGQSFDLRKALSS